MEQKKRLATALTGSATLITKEHMKIYHLLFVLVCFFTLNTFAADATTAADGKLSHESEAGVILTAGNSDTQTYSLKQLTEYTWTGNTVRFTAAYLLGKTSGIETAKKWDLGLRYDRALFDNLSAFLGYQIDANPFSGIYLRHTVDAGGKYDFIKQDNRTLLAELGYRMTAEDFTLNNGTSKSGSLTSHMSRAYVEYKEAWTKSFSTKAYIEYLQSYTNTKDYRINFEPSASMLLSEVFSVKLAYLLAFRNVPAVAGKKQTDTTFTTSLVAKF